MGTDDPDGKFHADPKNLTDLAGGPITPEMILKGKKSLEDESRRYWREGYAAILPVWLLWAAGMTIPPGTDEEGMAVLTEMKGIRWPKKKG